MVFGCIGGGTAEPWSVRGTVAAGLTVSSVGAVGLLAAAIGHLPLAAVVLSLLALVSGVAVTTPPSTMLALAEYPQMAGTASSLLGMARFAFGAVAAPLVGVAGAATMVPLGVVITVSIALAVASCLLLVRRTAGPAASSVPARSATHSSPRQK